jgi:hypothetical protein
MINKNIAQNCLLSQSDDEQRLRALIRQHIQISEEIISIVLKTTAEAEQLIQTLDRQLRTQLIHSQNQGEPKIM